MNFSILYMYLSSHETMFVIPVLYICVSMLKYIFATMFIYPQINVSNVCCDCLSVVFF
jgi:hypothetical protein